MRSLSLGSILGIPVTVSPWYFLLLYFLGRGDAQTGMIYGACITAGLMVHEFGHALVARAFGLQPQVLLHGFGGLTAHGRPERDVQEALITASGPAAGLVFGLLTVVAALVFGGMGLLDAGPLSTTIQALMWVNIGWSVLNLMPVWPLDGGHLFRLGMLRVFSPMLAERVTHGVSLLVISVGAYYSYTSGLTFNLILLGLLGWQNLQVLRGQASGGGVRARGAGKELINAANTALAEGNYKEAARLCHQLRSSTNLGPNELGKVWTILGLASLAMEEHEEALAYLRRAPASAAVSKATRRCLVALGREEELPQLEARQQHGRKGGRLRLLLMIELAFLATAVGLSLVGFFWFASAF